MSNNNELVKLSDVLNIYKPDQLNEFLIEYTGFNLEEKGLTESKIKNNWEFVGGSESNGSQINILKYGEKGLVERVTNAIDAVIEKQRIECNVKSPQTSNQIIKKAFPKYYENKTKVADSSVSSSYCFEAEDQVILVVNDCSKSNKPTFDIVDKGTGIEGEKFKDTILSLNRGNKLSREKSYLIGAFGQGGSTSLAFAAATIIVSKTNNKYYFTVVKKVDLNDYKNYCYVYLTINNKIPELYIDEFHHDDKYINDYLNCESGTFIRMIEADITKQFRDNEVTKPGMLHDYLNTELFNVGLPVKVIENRKMYSTNAHVQNRNVYGSFSKLQTWSYIQKNYSGSMNIIYRDRTYKIDYYAILPKKEEDWGRDSKCKDTFVQFNVTLDPFVYIVNGQMIATESFAKLKNAGLNFMRYRLLIVIDLDVLGNDKYKFFTTDRAQIKDTDQTKEFFDKVVKEIANVDKLKELNSIISEKAINSTIDNSLVDEISQEVKGLYSKYLKFGLLAPKGKHHPGHDTTEEVFNDEITEIIIQNTKKEYYKDEIINIILKTSARKDINNEANIYCYIDGNASYAFTDSKMNGRIQYSFASGIIKPGFHQINYIYYQKKGNTSRNIESNTYSFEIKNEKSHEIIGGQRDRKLNLEIKLLKEQELICDISKNIETGLILANVCFDCDCLMSEVFNRSTSDQIMETRQKLIKPIVLFALFMGDDYEAIKVAEEKNKMMITFIKTLIAIDDGLN